MELSHFTNGIAMHNAVIRQVLNNEALYVKHEDGYSYTVGMRDIGAPELVIYGQRNGVSTEMFKIIYNAAAQSFGAPAMPMIVKTVFDPAPGLVVLPESEKMAVFYAARTYYEDWSFSAARLILNQDKVYPGL